MAAQYSWKDFIEPEDDSIPLHALRCSCLERMSYYLNQDVQLRPGMRYKPNYGGLAELIGLDGVDIGETSRRENPGLAVLEMWKEKKNLQPTVGNFVKYLCKLGRHDILTDNAEWMREEIEGHKRRQQNIEIQSTVVSSAASMEETNRILTIDDVMGDTAIYDAFVCYDGADLDFVKAMIAKLEDPQQYGFRLFIPGRNNLGGTNDNALMTKIISERCRHMIVVLSQRYLESQACEFQTAYAFSLSPGARDKKIVPLKVEECRVPNTLQIMACCDFTNQNLLDWSWKRLIYSIMCPMPNSDFLGPHRFVPPEGTVLAQQRTRHGMAEIGGGNLDSGFSSAGSSINSRRGPVTAPVSATPPQPSPSTPSGRPGPSHTTPLPSHSQPGRDRSPSLQALKRFTQGIYKKKNKTPPKRGPPDDEPPETAM